MPAELITYGGSDRRLVLTNAEAIRAPIYLGTWNTIRIGMLCAFDAPATINGTPRLAYGVCSGSTDGYGSPNSTHVVGIRTTGTSWSRSAGPPPTLNLSNTRVAFKKIGSTVSSSSVFSSNNLYLPATTDVLSGVIWEIVKGSPNSTFRHAGPTSAAGAQVSMTLAQLRIAMEAAVLEGDALPSNYSLQGSGHTLAVDEADGVLDHLFVHWDRTEAAFTISTIMHRIVA